jgi:hypothetical protein
VFARERAAVMLQRRVRGRLARRRIKLMKTAATSMQRRFRGKLARAELGALLAPLSGLVIAKVRVEAIASTASHRLGWGEKHLPSLKVAFSLERSVGKTTRQETSIKYNTATPKWEEAELSFERVPVWPILVIQIWNQEMVDGDDDLVAEEREELVAARRMRLKCSKGPVRVELGEGHVVCFSVGTTKVSHFGDASASGARSTRDAVLPKAACVPSGDGDSADSPSRRAGFALDHEAGMIVVLGPPSEIKERFCERLALRTCGCLLCVASLLTAAEHASAAAAAGNEMSSELEAALAHALSPRQLAQLVEARAAGEPGSPALLSQLVRAATEHTRWPRILLDFVQTREELDALERRAGEARVLAAVEVRTSRDLGSLLVQPKPLPKGREQGEQTLTGDPERVVARVGAEAKEAEECKAREEAHSNITRAATAKRIWESSSPIFARSCRLIRVPLVKIDVPAHATDGGSGGGTDGEAVSADDHALFLEKHMAQPLRHLGIPFKPAPSLIQCAIRLQRQIRRALESGRISRKRLARAEGSRRKLRAARRKMSFISEATSLADVDTASPCRRPVSSASAAPHHGPCDGSRGASRGASSESPSRLLQGIRCFAARRSYICRTISSGGYRRTSATSSTSPRRGRHTASWSPPPPLPTGHRPSSRGLYGLRCTNSGAGSLRQAALTAFGVSPTAQSKARRHARKATSPTSRHRSL